MNVEIFIYLFLMCFNTTESAIRLGLSVHSYAKKSHKFVCEIQVVTHSVLDPRTLTGYIQGKGKSQGAGCWLV